MALDFANEPEEILEAFAPYYERTFLREGTDPNLLYDLQGHLADFRFNDQAQVDRFAALYFKPGTTQDKLHAALAPVAESPLRHRPRSAPSRQSNSLLALRCPRPAGAIRKTPSPARGKGWEKGKGKGV